jgi:hypothetical protein
MAKVLERSLYQTDYYAWTKDQAAKLRALAAPRVNSTLDLENLAEEVESLGRSDLNLEFSPSTAPRADWRYSVAQARDEVEDHITASMRPDVAADLAKLFGRARRDAALGPARHGEHAAAKTLPRECPYSFDQIVSHDWHPQNRHDIVDDLEMTPEFGVAQAAPRHSGIADASGEGAVNLRLHQAATSQSCRSPQGHSAESAEAAGRSHMPGLSSLVPSTFWSKSTTAPVIRPDSSAHRNAIARATSSKPTRQPPTTSTTAAMVPSKVRIL